MHRIALLGSTGSIGTSTLDVVRGLGEPFEIVSVAAGSNWDAVARQIDEFRPRRAAMFQPEAAVELRQSLNGHPTEVLEGTDGICDLACDPEVDIVIMGISGASALPAAVEAVKAGKRVGLANKEALVMAGEILNPLAQDSGAEIIPVDSEHSALFQSLKSGNHGEVNRLLLTASGGPFRETPKEEFQGITPEQALKHPTWDMGRKITIDSATMMNKSLEIIEAHWLFNMPADKIDVVVHPQSIVHSMVEYCDGSVIAQLGLPDMRVPIQLAITYPKRMKSPVPPPDWSQIGELNFSKPDFEKFPSLKMGFRAASEGGTLGAVMNAANEVAVNLFFERQISFLEIFELVESVMDAHEVNAKPSLEEVFAADGWARQQAGNWVREN
ncbi:MAG: 1-deoxy-D-xylulose-5-phosphate reductoisomerase [Planctomycetota bacterium]|jgi:1-deoxy-D-xylulose-5-phosphate reductoisomerase|nr:1-deoxy-D-xylulose-5-phosphate reductoisomerase [Planctomycetota bacterium]